MATRAFIGVVVNPQDKGKTIEPNLELLGKAIHTQLIGSPEFHKTKINETTEVICIYHHNDGSPCSLGETLLDEFNSYDKALNLVSFGDASTINGYSATFYNSWREGESWENTKPTQCDSIDEYREMCDEPYTYIFKDEKWYVREWNEDWKELEDIINY